MAERALPAQSDSNIPSAIAAVDWYVAGLTLRAAGKQAGCDMGEAKRGYQDAMARLSRVADEVANLRAEKRAYRAVGDEMAAELDQFEGRR